MSENTHQTEQLPLQMKELASAKLGPQGPHRGMKNAAVVQRPQFILERLELFQDADRAMRVEGP